MIYFGQPILRLYDDHAVHSAAYMIIHFRNGAVIDKGTGIHGLKLDGFGLARGHIGGIGSASGAVYRVEINIMQHGTILCGPERKYDGIALAHAYHRTGHLIAEGHILELNPIFYLSGQLIRY